MGDALHYEFGLSGLSLMRAFGLYQVFSGSKTGLLLAALRSNVVMIICVPCTDLKIIQQSLHDTHLITENYFDLGAIEHLFFRPRIYRKIMQAIRYSSVTRFEGVLCLKVPQTIVTYMIHNYYNCQGEGNQPRLHDLFF